MHLCPVCDALCDCGGDTSGIIGNVRTNGCSHCSLCCEHGYPLDGPCQFCETDDFELEDDAPPEPTDSAA